MVRVILPPIFRQDRAERDLPVGEKVESKRGGLVLVEISEADAREYLNDAEHYADANGPDVSLALKVSARATVTRLRQALNQISP